jgi:aspartyl-tRNA(Asn)/glutamyl-tRNA(Gln) amidotransferase subunit C
MAQTLSYQEVAEIALLARLALSEDEIESLRAELSAILEHMDALEGLDTQGVEPMTHALPMTLRLRDDVAGASLSADRALSAAPDRAGDYFQVPNIIKSAQGE